MSMWNDEDNNPYGSYDRRDSSSDVGRPSSPTSRFAQPSTPPSGSSTPQHEPPEYPDEEGVDNDSAHDGSEAAPRKHGNYTSRVEQVLSEQPEVQVVITHAGKNMEGGGSYIAYTIRLGDIEVRRRYSDFYSLRETLVRLHPTLIIPPIPEKHSMADYAAKPTKAKEDEAIIDHRKRMLSSFLNRCRRMQDVREDGVFWKFLEPNATWSSVLQSPPITNLPKNNLKAPPLDPANPTPGHKYLPLPSSTAKLKAAKDSQQSPSGTPQVIPPTSAYPSAAAHTTPGPQVFGKLPPLNGTLSEAELDPYFVSFESLSGELEALMQGSMEKVNKRSISHFGAFAEDMGDLGGKLNAFSLSEQSPTVAAAVEKVGQAVDSTYIATMDLSSSLSASFSEPMRESAQFAGIVRKVLRYRILKRVQGEMAKDELEQKKAKLEQLERSEAEAQRIEQHLTQSGFGPASPPRSTSSDRSNHNRQEDNDSIDSDFPPNHHGQTMPSESSSPKKNGSGNFITNKLFGSVSHAIKGVVDVDPERTRRDQIGRTKESVAQLEQALHVSEKDVKEASMGVLKSLRGFQNEKEDDLRRYMMAYAQCHIDWAKRSLAAWEEAKGEIDKIDVR